MLESQPTRAHEPNFLFNQNEDFDLSTVWTPEQIKAELKSRNVTLTMIANKLSLTVSTVSNAVSKRSSSPRTAQLISRIIEQPFDQLFGDVPEYYTKTKAQAQAEFDALFATA